MKTLYRSQGIPSTKFYITGMANLRPLPVRGGPAMQIQNVNLAFDLMKMSEISW